MQTASLVQFAHYFFVCKNELELFEALSFPGFNEKLLLIQEYVEHQEQVYKIFAIGPDWYRSNIVKSIPHDLVVGSPSAFQWENIKDKLTFKLD